MQTITRQNIRNLGHGHIFEYNRQMEMEKEEKKPTHFFFPLPASTMP